MTIILVEQRLRAALAFSQSVIVLERGRIAWRGTPAQLTADPDTIDKVLGVSHAPP
jgi:branched-chain amino acid transport system ATP-binding protein